MKKCRLLIFLVIVVFTLSSATFPANATSGVIDYSITEAFTYTVVPGTSEWETLDTLAKKIDACYVPLEVVEHMTTEALVETVLSYPLLINIYAYNSIEIGIEVVSNYFTGLGELLNRDDAYAVLSAYSSNNAARSFDSDISLIYCNTLLSALSTTSNLDVSPRSVSATVTTPAGSSVSVYVNRTWADAGTSYNAAYTLSQQYETTYPSASIVGVPSPSYNCHSYAWYSQTPNSVWIDNPEIYMTDGSYTGCSVTVGCKIYYSFADSSWNHSGIITALPSGGNEAVVTSKWGCLALFSHYVNDCPYSDYGGSMVVSCWN